MRVTAGRRALAGIALALALAVPVAAAAAGGAVSVEGRRFLRDGRPWVAEGVVLVGRVAPAAAVAGSPAYAAARQRLDAGTFAAIRDYGADLVRFQVSQAGLDPEAPGHDPAYRGEVLAAVAEARAAGLSVIVSMRKPLVRVGPDNMPTDVTRRAWGAIVGPLSQDRGVLLELYNEPGLKERTAENWAAWRTDMQSLIDLVRRAGAPNVLLVDGLRAAHYLGGAPALHDPLGQLGYAVHPYLTATNRTPAQWDRNFGDFAREHPVMATEFNARSANGYCRESFPREVDTLLGYLRDRDIGLVIWAFDLPGVRRADGRLSSYRQFRCGPGGNGDGDGSDGGSDGGGAGEAVHADFLAH